ncbi:winged helix-turn-helix domain-containing protein [Bradyrhizobium sp. LM6.9]
MSSPTDRTYSFGHWLIDCQRRELRYDNVAVPIGSRAFEILEKLVGSAGLLVTKDDLIGSVWSGLTVEDNTLQVHISAVRKALGEDRNLLKTGFGPRIHTRRDLAKRASGLPFGHTCHGARRCTLFRQPAEHPRASHRTRRLSETIG